jgi:hypothetical protein
MATTNVPREEWSDFLESVGREHEGWVVAVERMDIPYNQAADEEVRHLELHESTLDAVDVEIDEDEATLIIKFIDNDTLHIDNLVRVAHEEVEEQDGKIVELETRNRHIVRLWLRMPKVGPIEDLQETDLKEEYDEPTGAESILQIKPLP